MEALTDAKKANADYYVPVTQEFEFLDGLENISADIRASVLEVLEELNPEQIELNSAPYGVAPFGHGPFGEVSDAYKELLDSMNGLEEHRNNSWDVLGAETAISGFGICD
jgi:hypothetical protein